MTSTERQQMESVAVEIRLDIASLDAAIAVYEKRIPKAEMPGFPTATIIDMKLLKSRLQRQLWEVESQLNAWARNGQ